MPADGLVMAKEAFRLVEQLQGYQGEEVASYLFHAYGTNLQFGEGEFNFVKTRAELGTKKAFELRDEHFDDPRAVAHRSPRSPLRRTGLGRSVTGSARAQPEQVGVVVRGGSGWVVAVRSWCRRRRSPTRR